MKTDAYTKEIDDLIYLIACAVRGDAPDRGRVDQMDLDAVCQLSAYHSLTALVAFALERIMPLPYGFEQAKKKAIRKLVLFDIERSKIFRSLNSEGIWYLPLKGIVLKDCYPKYGMREMADNDVLCDAERMADVKRIMESLGFECEKYGKGVHDIYSKPPVAFEMHRTLFDEKETKWLYDHYKNVKSKLIKVSEDGTEYRFSNEDLYIYFIAHEYKHYILGGTGLRSLADVYAFLNRWKDELDRSYIDEELNKLGIGDFERMNRDLSKAMFSGRSLTENEKASLLYFVSSGTYGTVEGYLHSYISDKLSNDDSGKAKRRYILGRLFVHGDELKAKFPFFYRHKYLLPFLYIQRIFKAAFVNPQKVKRELKELDGFKLADDDKTGCKQSDSRG